MFNVIKYKYYQYFLFGFLPTTQNNFITNSHFNINLTYLLFLFNLKFSLIRQLTPVINSYLNIILICSSSCKSCGSFFRSVFIFKQE